MVLVIDNYDSFTYNLVQYLGELDSPIVVRNDKIDLEKIDSMAPDHIVISPGPGRPEDAGISCRLIEHFQGDIPLLGVCLGHQCIGEVFGGEVVKAPRVYHGKTSSIYFSSSTGHPLFADIDFPFTATRYHSLTLDRDSLPEELEVLAQTEDGEIMCVSHRSLPVFGVQFHPESILTEHGRDLLNNFLQIE